MKSIDVLTERASGPGSRGESLSTNLSTSRFGLNFASNVAYMVLSTVLMLWYVPFLIDNLGVAAYGMVPLANALVMFTVILSSSLDVSLNRFLAIDLNRGEIASANRTFNTALALAAGVCGLLLVPGLALIWLFPSIFQVPAGLENQARLLFAAVLLTSLTAILSANFAVSSLVLHRFDLRNLVRGLTMLTRVGLPIICFLSMPAQLWHVAAGFAAAAAVGLVGDMLVWRRLTPQLRLHSADVQRKRMRELLGLGGWSVINQLGILLLMQTDLVIVNYLFGPILTGIYGSLLLFPQLIHTLTETVVSILSPAIMARYAVGDSAGLRAYTVRSLRLLGLALALPIGLLCGLGGPLLEVWLGPEFRQYHLLLILLVGHLSVNLAARPLAYVLTAYNKMRAQAIWTLGLGAFSIVLAISLARWSPLGALGIAVASGLIWSLKNILVLPLYSSRLLKVSWSSLFVPLAVGLLAMLGVALTSWGLTTIWWPQSWLEIVALGACIGTGYCVAVYAVGLQREDRQLLRSAIGR